MIALFINDITLEGILEEQYQLSKEANISISDSNNLVDFERKAYLGKILRDERKKEEYLNKYKK